MADTKIICLDTNILIWGIKGESTEGQKDYVEMTKILMLLSLLLL